MSRTSDLRYDRQGGRFIDPLPLAEATAPLPVKPMPRGRTQLANHLRIDHPPVTTATLDAATDIELTNWHAAEHRMRTAPDGAVRHHGHLHHTHPAAALKAMGLTVKDTKKP